MVTGSGAVRKERRAPRTNESAETELLARISEREIAAFEMLYRLYQPRLNRFLWKLTRRPTVVDEVVNDTMLVVWSRPEGFNGTSRLSSWIFGIAYRKALKAIGKQDMPVEDAGDERPSTEPSPEQRLGERMASRAVIDLLAELSADHRAVVELTYFHDFGYREIAEIMDCPVDTVKSRMFYARRHLGHLISGDLADWL